jgi:hypothetical protein
MEESVRKNGRQYIGYAHCCPEEAESERQLVMLIEVGQVQNHLRGGNLLVAMVDAYEL